MAVICELQLQLNEPFGTRGNQKSGNPATYGRDVAFLGSQYRLEVSDQEYFIDLLLYHRRLRCLVAIDLKIGRFELEHVGKMQFYLVVLNDQVWLEDENPSIGIILCKSKDKTIVEYALKDADKPIGVATYRVVSTLPQELMGELPDPAEIAKLLEGVEE